MGSAARRTMGTVTRAAAFTRHSSDQRSSLTSAHTVDMRAQSKPFECNVKACERVRTATGTQPWTLAGQALDRRSAMALHKPFPAEVMILLCTISSTDPAAHLRRCSSARRSGSSQSPTTALAQRPVRRTPQTDGRFRCGRNGAAWAAAYASRSETPRFRPKRQQGPDRASLPLWSSSATALALPLWSSSATALASPARGLQIKPISATAASQSTSRSVARSVPDTRACRPKRHDALAGIELAPGSCRLLLAWKTGRLAALLELTVGVVRG